MVNEEQLSGRVLAAVVLVVALILVPLGRELNRQYRKNRFHEAGKIRDASPRTTGEVIAETAPVGSSRLRPDAHLRRLPRGLQISVRALYHATSQSITGAGSIPGNQWSIGPTAAPNASALNGWKAIWDSIPFATHPASVIVKLSIPASSLTAPEGSYTLLIRSLPDGKGNIDIYRCDFELSGPHLPCPGYSKNSPHS